MKKITLLSILVSQLLFFALLPIYFHLFHYLHPIVLVVVWFCQTVMVFFVAFFKCKIKIKIPSYLFYSLFILYSLCLFVLLFFRPNDQSYDNYNLVPFQTIIFYLSGSVAPLIAIYNLAANVGLFIPYGILLMNRKRTPLQRFLFPLLVILLIEITQFITNRGSLDTDDIILNLFGVFIGYWIYPIFAKVIDIHKWSNKNH